MSTHWIGAQNSDCKNTEGSAWPKCEKLRNAAARRGSKQRDPRGPQNSTARAVYTACAACAWFGGVAGASGFKNGSRPEDWRLTADCSSWSLFCAGRFEVAGGEKRRGPVCAGVEQGDGQGGRRGDSTAGGMRWYVVLHGAFCRRRWALAPFFVEYKNGADLRCGTWPSTHHSVPRGGRRRAAVGRGE